MQRAAQRAQRAVTLHGAPRAVVDAPARDAGAHVARHAAPPRHAVDQQPIAVHGVQAHLRAPAPVLAPAPPKRQPPPVEIKRRGARQPVAATRATGLAASGLPAGQVAHVEVGQPRAGAIDLREGDLLAPYRGQERRAVRAAARGHATLGAPREVVGEQVTAAPGRIGRQRGRGRAGSRLTLTARVDRHRGPVGTRAQIDVVPTSRLSGQGGRPRRRRAGHRHARTQRQDVRGGAPRCRGAMFPPTRSIAIKTGLR